MAKSVTYQNNHMAYAMLYGRRKGWLEGWLDGYPTVTFASIERTNRRLKHATNMSIHLEGKRHKPVKYWKIAMAYSHYNANIAERKARLLWFHRKKWKRINNMTNELMRKALIKRKK